MNAPVTKIKNQRSESQNSPNEVRVAYPFFHEKRTKNAAGVLFMKKDGTPNPRYSGTLMFPKLSQDPQQCPNYQFLWGLAQEAARKMWPQNVDQSGQWVWPQGAQLDIKDGDVPFATKPKPGQPMPSPEEVARKNAWRRGYWIVEVEQFFDPGPRICKVVNGQVVELPAKVINGVPQYKSGDWGIPNIHAYAYQNETFGVNFGFEGFLFTREGELIGNSGPRTAQQMFGGVALPPGAGMGAAPQVPQQPQQYAPPMPQPQVPNYTAGGTPPVGLPHPTPPLPPAGNAAPVQGYAPPMPQQPQQYAPPMPPSAPQLPPMPPVG